MSVRVKPLSRFLFLKQPYNLAYELGGREFCENCSVLPLGFINKDEEKEYFNRFLQRFKLRNDLGCSLTFTVILGSWLISGLGVSLRWLPQWDVPLGNFTINLMFLCCCLGVLLLFFMPRSKILEKNAEFWIYVAVFSILVVVYGYLVVTVIIFPCVTYFDEFLLIQFRQWAFILTCGLPMWVLILLFNNLGTRTKYMVLALAFNLCYGVPAYIFYSAALTVKRERNHPELRSLIANDCVIMLLVLVMSGMTVIVGLFGRWYTELVDRTLFWSNKKSQQMIDALIDDRKNVKRRRKVSTPVEELLELLKRAASCIQSAEAVSENKLIVECIEISREIETILLKGENVYKINISRTIKSSSEDRVEKALYEIYAGTKISTEKAPQLKCKLKGDRLYVQPSPAPDSASSEFRSMVGRVWDINLLKAAEDYSSIMTAVGPLLVEFRTGDELSASPVIITNYIHKLEQAYRPNPYHNATHAAMVAHSLMCLLRMLKVVESPLYQPIDNVAIVIAALGHDVGHPGRNNQFFTNSFHRAALLWNDHAVLESFHCALTLRFLEFSGCNFIESFDEQTKKLFRKNVVSLILATDMSQHFEMIAKFKLKRQGKEFDFYKQLEDFWFVIRMCIKCADLSHSAVEWSQHEEWSLRVAEEFYQQGEEEGELGVPISPMCDRSRHSEIARSQKGFIEFVIQPLYSQIEEIDSTKKIGDTCLKQLAYNKMKWENLISQETVREVPSFIKSMKTESSAIKALILSVMVPKGYRLTRKSSESKMSRRFSGIEMARPHEESAVMRDQTKSLRERQETYKGAPRIEETYKVEETPEIGETPKVEEILKSSGLIIMKKTKESIEGHDGKGDEIEKTDVEEEATRKENEREKAIGVEKEEKIMKERKMTAIEFAGYLEVPLRK